MASGAHAAGKMQCTFTVRHATLQDELVFKSLVRFLTDLLRHRWRYEASDTADVIVVGYTWADDGFDGSKSSLANRVHIRVGASEAAPKRLVRPLRVSAVLLALNLAGDELSQLRVGSSVQAPTGKIIFALLRWPTLELLRIDKRFVRIAAVLAAKPSTFEDLVQKSAQDEAVCAQLLRLLSSAGLIHERRLAVERGEFASLTTAPPAVPMSPFTGVGSSPVGLRSASMSAASDLIQAKVSPSEQPQNGLWGRIRRRLGIGVAA